MRQAKAFLRSPRFGTHRLRSWMRSCLQFFGILPHLRKYLLVRNPRLVPASTMRFPSYDLKAASALAGVADYFRYATIGLALKRIEADHIPGQVAEVGVYQGLMSRFIHQLVPERRFYLFDTFTGFPTQDLEATNTDDQRFRDTSIAIVMHNIGSQRNIIIKQGYVPETFAGLEDEQFAFVLLDVDLYNPTISSLEFFYPRLSAGGYLMVHDYNNPESQWACKRAVDLFLRDKPERIIELADEWGSVMIRKL